LTGVGAPELVLKMVVLPKPLLPARLISSVPVPERDSPFAVS
jgi:hypothetical protein